MEDDFYRGDGLIRDANSWHHLFNDENADSILFLLGLLLCADPGCSAAQAAPSSLRGD